MARPLAVLLIVIFLERFTLVVLSGTIVGMVVLRIVVVLIVARIVQRAKNMHLIFLAPAAPTAEQTNIVALTKYAIGSVIVTKPVIAAEQDRTLFVVQRQLLIAHHIAPNVLLVHQH